MYFLELPVTFSSSISNSFDSSALIWLQGHEELEGMQLLEPFLLQLDVAGS